LKFIAWRTRLTGLLLLASCASGQKTTHTEAVQSHVYARPLDDVLTETTALLTQKGWHVERSGDLLGTNWRFDATGSALGYRVEGERIDDAHCSIHIESLAATSFAPGAPAGPGASNGASGGKSTGWDGVDAPTTLGEPPPGLVTLPRGRDEALEWALLQRLDPRTAQAIQGADARTLAAVGGADAGTEVSPGAVLSPPPAGCEPEPTGVDVPIADRRVVLLADVPGTNEIPDFVGRLACQAARKGIPTVVALELLRGDQEWVDTYLASGGSAADRTGFLQVMRSFGAQGSGAHGTEAVLALLDRIRTLRDAHLSLRVVAYDEAASSPQRDKARASTLERVRRVDPDAFLLVVVERAQARTVLAGGESSEKPPLGWSLARWGLRPLSLDVRSPGGQAFACDSGAHGACGQVPVHSKGSPAGATSHSVELYPSPDAQGFSGEYAVGPFTASSAPKP
jgi:hypothetical protein